MGHDQDRVSCVKEAENREAHSMDTISFQRSVDDNTLLEIL